MEVTFPPSLTLAPSSKIYLLASSVAAAIVATAWAAVSSSFVKVALVDYITGGCLNFLRFL